MHPMPIKGKTRIQTNGCMIVELDFRAQKADQAFECGGLWRRRGWLLDNDLIDSGDAKNDPGALVEQVQIKIVV